MAIILATELYDDKNYPELEFANRDGSVMRRYFKQAFGLSDFQLLPAKTWQMEGGPTENDFRKNTAVLTGLIIVLALIS